jgi:hypothetical protein
VLHTLRGVQAWGQFEASKQYNRFKGPTEGQSLPVGGIASDRCGSASLPRVNPCCKYQMQTTKSSEIESMKL